MSTLILNQTQAEEWVEKYGWKFLLGYAKTHEVSYEDFKVVAMEYPTLNEWGFGMFEYQKKQPYRLFTLTEFLSYAVQHDKEIPAFRVIENAIEAEEYDRARIVMSEVRKLCGYLPELAGFGTHIDLIEFLADAEDPHYEALLEISMTEFASDTDKSTWEQVEDWQDFAYNLRDIARKAIKYEETADGEEEEDES